MHREQEWAKHTRWWWCWWYLKVLTYYKVKQKQSWAFVNMRLFGFDCADRLTIIISAVQSRHTKYNKNKKKKQNDSQQRIQKTTRWCRVEESACRCDHAWNGKRKRLPMYFDFMAMKRKWTMCISLDFGQDTIVHLVLLLLLLLCALFLSPLNRYHWIMCKPNWFWLVYTVQSLQVNTYGCTTCVIKCNIWTKKSEEKRSTKFCAFFFIQNPSKRKLNSTLFANMLRENESAIARVWKRWWRLRGLQKRASERAREKERGKDGKVRAQ